MATQTKHTASHLDGSGKRWNTSEGHTQGYRSADVLWAFSKGFYFGFLAEKRQLAEMPS